VIIRAATDEDVVAMVDLLHATAVEGRWIGTEAPFDTDERARRLREALENGRFVGFVAVAGADTVGQLTLRLLDGRAYLGMVVAAAQRGRGVGRKLMKAAIAYAREQALHAIDLDVFEHNAAALGLYRSCGFVPCGAPGERVRQNGERFTAIPMTLDLA
jgi:ribosomal protein S18 acetylase RimI-like enzyme